MNNGKICVSVCAETANEFIVNIKRAEELADVIELRFDCLEKNELTGFLSQINKIEKRFLNEFLITFRSLEQGGKRRLSLRERLKFWEFFFANKMRNDYYVDFEFDLHSLLKFKSVKSVASHHDFFGFSGNLTANYEFLTYADSDIVKIAVQTDDICDTIDIWKLLKKANSDKKQIIPIAMGEAGKWTRILGLAHGAYMTYASLDAGNETAPGQISAQDLIETYRVKELNEQTDVYGILGSNTSVSMSPYIHNAAFKFHDLNAVFVPLQVQDLDEFIRRMVNPKTREIELNFKGFAVTIPHKQAIIKHLDFVDETAGAIGAVNTVKIEDGKLYGYNTDAQGFIEPLKNSYGILRDAKVAILGNGGAARACIYALKKEGAKVVIFARNPKKAESLANEFQVELKELTKTENQSPKTNFNEFDLVVNTTPLGMKGKFENETPVVAGQIENVKLVYDLVYNPFETRFLKEAKSVGVPTIGGLAMLVAQAMEQSKIWTGLDAPMKVISQAALRKLQP